MRNNVKPPCLRAMKASFYNCYRLKCCFLLTSAIRNSLVSNYPRDRAAKGLSNNFLSTAFSEFKTII